MRIVGFDGGRIGVVKGDALCDVTDVVAETWPSSAAVNRLIASFADLEPNLRGKLASGTWRPLTDVQLTAPVPKPGTLFAMPANYDDHVAEMASPNRADRNSFFVLAPSSISGPSDTVVLPDLPGYRVDHECELAIIVGREGRHVRRENAMDHVFGYSCLVDLTVRGPQERASRKSFETFTPLGPWMVTRDEVDDPDDISLKLWVNDKLRHDGSTRDLIVDIRGIIEMVSSVSMIRPGDVIATGTPAGVGPVVAGDTIRIWVQNIGEMTLSVHQGQPIENRAFSQAVAN